MGLPCDGPYNGVVPAMLASRNGGLNSIRLIYAIEAYETIGFPRHLEMAREVVAKL